MCRTGEGWQGRDWMPETRLSTDKLQVYAAGSEDMDTLTFNSPILLRHLTFSEARKEPILEVRLDAVLEGLEMELPQVNRAHQI